MRLFCTAGGGSDIAAYCDLYGGAVLNASINLSSYCTIEPCDDGSIRDFNSGSPLQIKRRILSELEASTVLYYTGVSRSSGMIIAQ